MKDALYIALRIIRASKHSQNISSPAIKIGSVAVGMGIMVMLLSVSVIKGFKHQINSKLKSLTSHVVIMPYQVSEDITSHPLKISEDTLKMIQNISLIEHIEPVCIKQGILKIKEENEGLVFKGVTKNYQWQQLSAYLTEGKFPQYHDSAISKEVVISKKLADRMQIHLNQKIIVYFIVKNKHSENDRITYRSKDLVVAGIIHPQMGELDNQLIYGDAKLIQKINEWTADEFSQIEIYGKHSVSSDAIISKLIDVIPYNYKLVSAEELYSNIFNWLEMIDINAIIIIVLMLIVAAVNMTSALIILILEKTNLIGILKALGMNTHRIKNVFLFISLKILGWGLLIGNIIAISIIFLQQEYHLFHLNPEAYYVDYIPVEWNWGDWILLNAGTIFICLGGMFIPTFLITKLSPAQIIRWE